MFPNRHETRVPQRRAPARSFCDSLGSMCCSTAFVLSSGISCRPSEMFIMAACRFPAASPPRLSLAYSDRSRPSQSMSAVEQRLAATERELGIQFTRIAQLQAELDLLLRALRRSVAGT